MLYTIGYKFEKEYFLFLKSVNGLSKERFNYCISFKLWMIVIFEVLFNGVLK